MYATQAFDRVTLSLWVRNEEGSCVGSHRSPCFLLLPERLCPQAFLFALSMLYFFIDLPLNKITSEAPMHICSTSDLLNFISFPTTSNFIYSLALLS